MAGCDCGEGGNLNEYSQIKVEPQNIAFSAISVGEEETKIATVTNTGQLDLRIESIKLIEVDENTPFSLSDAKKWTFPITVSKGESLTIPIRYAPTQAGAFKGKVRLITDAKNAGDEGETDIKLISTYIGGLLLAPNPVDFGYVPPKEKKSKKVTITNNGQAKVTITKITFKKNETGEFAILKQPTLPVELDANGATELELEYTPKAPKANGIIDLTLDDGNTFSLNLVGRMSAPNLEVSPETLQFVDPQVGKMVKAKLTLKNVGNLELVINKMDIDATSAEGYSIPSPPTLPLKIAPEKEVVLEVAFTAKDIDKTQGKLNIDSNDPNKPQVVVPLLASAGGCALKAIPAQLSFTKDGVKQVILANSGTEKCTLSNIKLDEKGSNEFTLGNTPKANHVLGPNENVKVEVTFKGGSNKPQTSNLLVTSNDPKNPTLTVPIESRPPNTKACDIKIQPTILQFGFVGIGQSKTAGVTVINNGYDECLIKISGVSDPLQVFSLQTSIPVQGRTIKSGQQFNIDVSYAPRNSTVAQGELLLTTTDPALPTARIPLLGYSGQLCLEIIPRPLDFGSIRKGCRSRDIDMDIVNTCTRTVSVTAIKWGATTSPEFSLSQPASTPRQLNSGQSMGIKVRYTPKDLGQDRGVLQIENDVPGQTPINVITAGQGISTSEQTDTFTQEKQPKIDILFVIDDSNSMKDNQNNLSQNLGSFMKWANQLNADYHIAVTTTDADCGTKYKYDPAKKICDRPSRPDIPNTGCFRGSQKVITPQTPNGLTLFSNNVKVGLNGSGNEQGIEASYKALQPDRLNDCNQGFLRNDASLSIVYVSDESDSSPNSIAFYVKFFLGLKKNNNALVRASAVVGPPGNGCANGSQQAKAAPRYWDIATQMQGVTASICSTNWSNTLSQLGAVTFGRKRSFALSQAADPNSIVVKINGQTVTQGWSYDTSSNSIVFETGSIPAAGAQIVVTYKTQCIAP